MKKKSYPEVFNRLDQAFMVWEQLMWRMNMTRHVLRDKDSDLTEEQRSLKNGFRGYPFENSAETKERLLKAVAQNNLSRLLPEYIPEGVVLENICDITRMPKKADAKNPQIAAFSDELLFPYLLGRWCQSSRRMYYLSDDLVNLLDATSLKGVCLGDIKLPFDSFVLTLETPLRLEENVLADCILLSDPFELLGRICVFNQSLREQKPFDREYRARMDKSVRQGNHDKLLQLVGRRAEKFENLAARSRMYWDCKSLPSEGNENRQEWLIEDLLGPLSTHSNEQLRKWSKIFRVIMGFCLYLRSTDAKQGVLSSPERIQSNVGPEIRKGGKALLDSAEVLHVQSVVKLSMSQRNALREGLSDEASGRSVSTHFRRGFWRRPKGMGNDPTAEKTMWVRPTIVCRDKLPEGAIPLGAGQVLTV